MAEDTKTQQGQVKANGTAQIFIDKKKSPEQYVKEAEAKYIIPSLVRKKFPDLIKLIYETESMNEEEREYWLQILPIMSEEQIVKFRDILVNEKNQLEKLDREYEDEMSRINKATKPIDENTIKTKMKELKQAEQKSETEEINAEADLLNKLQNL